MCVAGLAFAACSGGEDLCTQAYTASATLDTEVDTCLGEPSPTLSQAGITECQQNLGNCNASEQTIIRNRATCEDNLPDVVCQWILDAQQGKIDPDYTAWMAQAATCVPAHPTSAQCQTETGIRFVDGGF